MTFFTPFEMPRQVARRVAAVDQETTQFPPSLGWDFERGDLLTDGAGRTVTVEGETAWQQAVRLCVMTQSSAYAAFPRTYGADLAAFVGLDNDADVVQVARRVFQAAVLADPRTASLSVVLLDQTDDLARFRLDATSKRGTSIGLEAVL